MAVFETDYCVIGTGAVGMAFVDTLLTQTDADVVMVDRHHMPGGHWNDAYPFVRLHQPSAFYGVPSIPLGSDRIDADGYNKGYYELASGPEVLAHFDRAMRERFLASGRVRYLPMHDALWDAQSLQSGRITVRSLLSDATHEVTARKRIVDGTYFGTTVPSTHQRKFSVADGVTCIAPNDLPRLAPSFRRFTILGGGKTGMDVGVWLLEQGADPDTITWVRPRESWLLNRAGTQPGPLFFHDSIGRFAAQMEAMAAAQSVEDLFDRLETGGVMLRIDPDDRPEMFHYATISIGEVELLRRIRTVIKGQRVTRIEPDRLVLSEGTASADPDTLYIDCTATAVEMRTVKPTFDGRLITLQMYRIPQPAFSASFVAFIEALFDNDEDRNRMCTPIALPDTVADWLPATVANMTNQYTWSQDARVGQWIETCRLDGFATTIRDADLDDPTQQATLKRLRENAFPGVINLQKIIEAGGASA